MARRKLAEDAFSFYQGLGAGRSYQAVAENYGVSKRTVTRCALRERWQERLHDMDEASVHESIEEITARHLAGYRLLKEKALEAMRRIGPDKVLAAARKLDGRRAKHKRPRSRFSP